MMQRRFVCKVTDGAPACKKDRHGIENQQVFDMAKRFAQNRKFDL